MATFFDDKRKRIVVNGQPTTGLLRFLHYKLFNRRVDMKYVVHDELDFGHRVAEIPASVFAHRKTRQHRKRAASVGMEVEELTSQRGKFLHDAMRALGYRVVDKQSIVYYSTNSSGTGRRRRRRVATMVDAVAQDVNGDLVIIEIKTGFLKTLEFRDPRAFKGNLRCPDTTLNRHVMQVSASFFMWNACRKTKAARAEIWYVNSTGIYRKEVDTHPAWPSIMSGG